MLHYHVCTAKNAETDNFVTIVNLLMVLLLGSLVLFATAVDYCK